MSRLPSGYMELEYIQSSGTQYIDTVINASTSLKFELSAKDYVIPTATPYVAPLAYGGGLNNWINKVGFNFGNSAGKIYCYWNYDVNTNISSMTNLEVEQYDGKLYINGSLVHSSTYTPASWNYPVYLFADNRAGVASNYSIFKCSKFKIWDNETLVRNYIPAQNSSDVVGLYDLVSNTFFTNAGTGSFIAGPTVLNPIIPTWGSGLANVNKSAIIRRRGLIGAKKSRLPAGYTELKWIQSTGEQYIITNYKPTVNSIIICRMRGGSGTNGYQGGGGGRTYWFGVSGGKYSSVVSDVYDDTKMSDVSAPSDDFHTFTLSSGSQKLDGVEYGTSTYSGTTAFPIYLFGCRLAWSNVVQKAKLYISSFIAMSDAQTVHMNLVPCINPSNVVGMYDLIGERFYGNNGTGSFVAGDPV